MLAEVAAVLGLGPGASFGTLSVDHLKQRTHRQLLESSRRLGLSGVSRLGKDVLAQKLWHALEQVGAFSLPVVEDAGHTVLSHKFELGERAQPAETPHESREIPWSYERDRVAAMAVDPDRLYAYWEVLDSSIERARGGLGPAGKDAVITLRVYDTSGRLFDGTNAHSYFDHVVSRDIRQWFFHIGKPTSEAFVEIGLKSPEGYFVKIARSGRVEFPRRAPVEWSDPEWLTVRVSTGHVERAGTRTPARAEGPQMNGPAPRLDATPFWALRHLPWQELRDWQEDWKNVDVRELREVSEWSQSFGDGSYEEHRTFAWEDGEAVHAWEAGPFSYPVEVSPPVKETFEGTPRVFRAAGKTRILYGPWHVVIRGLGAHIGRKVLSRWEVYRSWVASQGEQRTLSTVRGPAGSSDRMLVGSSERRWVGGSELRFTGASELYYIGASERRLGGASESLYIGASQWMMRGASERRFLGASELRLAGASERRLGSASELRLGGASEQVLAGASERMLGAYPHVTPPPVGATGVREPAKREG